MAQIIRLAKLPQGRDNKIILDEDKKQFYIEHNATMTIAEICKHLSISSQTMYVIIKRENLPKKIRVISKPVPVIAEYFSWEKATMLDPIFGLSRVIN